MLAIASKSSMRRNRESSQKSHAKSEYNPINSKNLSFAYPHESGVQSSRREIERKKFNSLFNTMVEESRSIKGINDSKSIVPKLALPVKKDIQKNYAKTERATDHSFSESQRSTRRRKNIFTREGPTYNLNDTITKELKRDQN